MDGTCTGEHGIGQGKIGLPRPGARRTASISCARSSARSTRTTSSIPARSSAIRGDSGPSRPFATLSTSRCRYIGSVFKDLQRENARASVRHCRGADRAGAVGGAGRPILCRLDPLPRRVRARGHRRSRPPVTVEGEATARILPFPSVTFAHVVVAGDRSRPSGDDRRELLDGCRAGAVPARRGADLRHAPGQAGRAHRHRDRRDRRLGGAPVLSVHARTDRTGAADDQRRPGFHPSRRQRTHPCAGQDRGERLGAAPWPVRGGPKAPLPWTAWRPRSKCRPDAPTMRPACGSGCAWIRRRWPSGSRATARFASTPAHSPIAAPSGWVPGLRPC